MLATLSLSLLLLACHTAPARRDTAVPPELLQPSYLFEIARYLYRWHLDQSEVERMEGQKQLIFWVRRLEPKLDPGDRSLEAEILLPQLQLTAKVKKEDYTIEELGIVEKSPNFRVTRLTRDQVPPRPPHDCSVVQVEMKELREYLFRTRNQHNFPDKALLEHLRQALRKEESTQGALANTLVGEQIFFLAPLSPMANEAWVLWEAGRKLFYIASDIDLANPAVWRYEALMVHKIYDLDEQVVGSHEEAPANNRFLTRDQVSRALFNCIVLGQRITVPP